MDINNSVSILDKVGPAISKGGLVGKVIEKQVKDPEFRKAFAEEYLNQKGNEIEKTYRAYKALAKKPEFKPLVEEELKTIAEITLGKDDGLIFNFVNDALNNTEEFIANANQVLTKASPEQINEIINGDKESARKTAESLAMAV